LNGRVRRLLIALAFVLLFLIAGIYWAKFHALRNHSVTPPIGFAATRGQSAYVIAAR
jgi:hypothetical protein